VLVHAQVRDWFQVIRQDGVRLFRERAVRGGSRDAVVPGGPGRGDPAFRDLVPAVLQQPPGDPAPRRDLRDPLGERALRAVTVPALQPPFTQDEPYFPVSVPDIPRTGRHVFVHFSGKGSAPRARDRAGDHRQTVNRPSASSSAPVTVTPSSPSSSDAVSWAGAGPWLLIVTNQDHRARASFTPAATRINLPHIDHNPPVGSAAWPQDYPT
jgi:hypothetical protein